jgi:phosphate transport system protein
MPFPTGKHSIPGFDPALDALHSDIVLMCSLVRRTASNVRRGFLENDDDLCAAAIADDEEIDLLEKQVDRTGTEILMKFQPFAYDLRVVLASIKLSAHLESVSDHFVVVARRLRQLGDLANAEDQELVAPLFDAVEKSLSEILEAFTGIDGHRAEKVRVQMEPLAESLRELEEQFTDQIGADHQRARSSIGMITVTRSLEQIAYLIESVAEDVIYVAEAKDIRHPGNRLAEEI